MLHEQARVVLYVQHDITCLKFFFFYHEILLMKDKKKIVLYKYRVKTIYTCLRLFSRLYAFYLIKMKMCSNINHHKKQY